MLGAVLVVSGATVVGPVLKFIRPSKTVNSALKWEGTLADPIGATLGVVMFNAGSPGLRSLAAGSPGLLLWVGIAAGLGVAGALLVLASVRSLKPNRRRWCPGRWCSSSRSSSAPICFAMTRL